jgi:hypothetical protein
MQTHQMLLLFFLFTLIGCQNRAEPADVTPQTDTVEPVLPDEHLILPADPTPTPNSTPELTLPLTIVSTPASPPLYLAQDGFLLRLDEESGDYGPDPAFPADLQGEVTAVHSFNNFAGHYWVAYGAANEAIAELFPDEGETWTNLLAAPVDEEAIFNSNWYRELIGFGERDLVIVDETAGINDFEFLLVHSPWSSQTAIVSDYRIDNVESLHRALNYLRATAANQGVLAITENGLEIAPSKLPRGWRVELGETGGLQLLDGAGKPIIGEEPQNYLLFEYITIVVSTARPSVVLPMYRNTEDESETRHFLQGGQLLVHHYIPEKQLWDRYIESSSDWQVAALGFSQTGVLLANPRQLLAHIQDPGWRGQLDTTSFPAGTILAGFYDWYVEGPQRFDYYLLGQDPQQFELLPRAFDQLVEAEAYFPLRFRLEFAEE